MLGLISALVTFVFVALVHQGTALVWERAAQALGIELVKDLDNVSRDADFITVHMPVTEHTRGMLNAVAFAKMKPKVRLVNCARGEVLVESDLLAALEEHRRSLQKRQAQLGRLIDTVDRTISYLKGMSTMDSQELFTGFSEEQQKKYEEEAAQKYGREKVEESSRRWSSYSPEERKRILKEGGQIYLDIAAAMPPAVRFSFIRSTGSLTQTVTV